MTKSLERSKTEETHIQGSLTELTAGFSLETMVAGR